MVGSKLRDLNNGNAFSNIINMIHEIDRTLDHSRRTANITSNFGSYDESNVKATKNLLKWFFKNKKCKDIYFDQYRHYSQKDFL